MDLDPGLVPIDYPNTSFAESRVDYQIETKQQNRALAQVTLIAQGL